MKHLRLLAATTVLTLAAGCASLNTVSADVSTFGTWPAGQAPGTYAIERLPSQQNADADQLALEDAASRALEQVGFTPAAVGTPADYTVQIGARISAQQRAPWDDPMWWGAWGPRWSSLSWYQPGWGWGYGPGYGPGWGVRGTWAMDTTDYRREVGVLIRERASGQAVYEARAQSSGVTRGSTALLGALYGAALKDFPQVQSKPHTVTVQLP